MTNLKDDMAILEQKLLEKEGLVDAMHKLVPSQSSSGTETPEGIYTFEAVAKAVEEYLPNVTTALKLAMAVATSGTRKNRVMLWLLLVGSPSSGKTDLVRLFKNNKNIYSVDNLTLNAFISGERPTEREKVHDLLPQLNNKCLVVKDWTVIFSLDERMTKKIIGDMVGAYDKNLVKFSSRRGNIGYDSEFSHIGCITPATLNKHQNYLNMIGPRFLSYSIPELSEDDENKSFGAIFSDTNRNDLEKKVADMVSAYLDQLNKRDISEVMPLNEKAKSFLRIASRFMARARGIVITQSSKFTNETGEEISYYEPLDIQIEQPWRAVQQLMILAKYLAFVVAKTEVNENELDIIRQVVLSSMPADRAQAMRALAAKQEGKITAKELADNADKSTKTARRLLDELVYLGLVTKDKGSGQLASTYSLAEEYKGFVKLPIGECLSAYSNSSNVEA